MQPEMLFRTKDNQERVDLAALDPNSKKMRNIRGGEISMIFQDPMTSLNPYLTVERQLTEVLEIHKNHTRKGQIILDRYHQRFPFWRARGLQGNVG